MTVGEIIEQLDELPTSELRRLRSAIDERLTGSPDGPTEEEFLRSLVERGLVRPADPSKATPLHERAPLVPIEGPPLSEQTIAERR